MKAKAGQNRLEVVKKQILEALAHPEAQDGLYFRNLYYLHEEDQRDAVEGTEIEILDALKDLMSSGKVRMDDQGEEVIFFLVDSAQNSQYS
jgi:aryl-alcohol dehydrogenase-like predicted oxidoreductase